MTCVVAQNRLLRAHTIRRKRDEGKRIQKFAAKGSSLVAENQGVLSGR